MPKYDYMKYQPELNWMNRADLIEWLIYIHYTFNLLPETLFLTVNLVDRFLSNNLVSMAKLRLVGITALFISAKYEEVLTPPIKNYIFIIKNIYKENEILDAECFLLGTIDYK